ncbi:MAG TPA: DUF3658 domain-containing protein [Edaphocola sp.]|nr:DUF3658 domain-containing protein [Edaphocola sp.]
MITVHIVVGDEAANTLKEAFAIIDNFNDEIWTIKDVFNVGPLRSETLPFSQLRTEFWRKITLNDKLLVDDLEQLMQLSTRLSNNEVDNICFWMAGIPADICTYYWLLHFLKKHIGKFLIININGLPFLDEEGRLFYPESISQLPGKQVIKAMKLLRPLSPSEWETDGEEWKNLIKDRESEIRIISGVKQIIGKSIDYYDANLLGEITKNNQKINKVVGNAISKFKIKTGDLFLVWRLKELELTGKVNINKENVKLFSDTSEEVIAPENNNQE